MEPQKKRKKSWNEKAEIVQNSVKRAMTSKFFGETFYQNLFFLDPELKNYFKKTDWDHQQIALIKGIDHLLGFLNKESDSHRNQIIRLAETHSAKNLNIHPQSYYYWIDALIMTTKELDHKWNEDFQYYMH